MPDDLSPRLLAVVEALPLRLGLRVLEIGPGPGAAAREVARRAQPGGYVLGVDRSSSAVTAARAAADAQGLSRVLEFRCVAVEDVHLLPDEPPYDMAFAARVGALDGRHPELQQRLVLERACRDAGLLRAALGREVVLTVNASGHQLVDAGFVDEVAAVLVDTGWPAEQLVVEVTESTVEIASAQALRSLAQLREMGVAVAIDDFGTGCSAFSHLDTLPADYLKLDAAFTAGITSSRRAAMLAALLDLADQLGLVRIAEGVESAEHANLLSLLGCPLAQGYFYARPAGVHDLLRRPADAGSLPPPVPALVSSAGG